jgi:hypothetical protein
MLSGMSFQSEMTADLGEFAELQPKTDSRKQENMKDCGKRDTCCADSMQFRLKRRSDCISCKLVSPQNSRAEALRTFSKKRNPCKPKT